jgi:hypothetical protein
MKLGAIKWKQKREKFLACDFFLKISAFDVLVGISRRILHRKFLDNDYIIVVINMR